MRIEKRSSALMAGSLSTIAAALAVTTAAPTPVAAAGHALQLAQAARNPCGAGSPCGPGRRGGMRNDSPCAPAAGAGSPCAPASGNMRSASPCSPAAAPASPCSPASAKPQASPCVTGQFRKPVCPGLARPTAWARRALFAGQPLRAESLKARSPA